MNLKRAVITGLGAVTPLGNNVPEYWKNLRSGISGAGSITRFDTTNFRTRFACEVKGFDPLDHFDAKEARKLDPFCQYALVAADEAMKDAGIGSDDIDCTRAGVIWASGMGGLTTLDEQLIEYAGRSNKPRFNPFFITKIISNMGAGLISIKYGFQGVNFAPVSACASSTNAIAEALLYIRLGKADVIIAGGSEAVITESGVGGFNAMKALSERNDSPQTASRPFDVSRDGFVMGEGAGALLIEELEHAQARGARIYAELVGAGVAADAYHMTAPHPEGLGAYLAMRHALADARLLPSDVDYVNAHATSTPTGDTIEIKAMARLFSEWLPNLSISATKSMTGHLLGAAGAVEAIACVKAIQNNIVPPTINTESVDPEVPSTADLTLGKERTRLINIAMSNSFGFGGHNATVVFSNID
ncbi:MAG TPA: beta-ketoacyl-ACP synthase II [Geobacteraceae bacterium]|mgnify:CR=1 FL=1|nr:beta-ketoacyl-ACP synthase II [Geobacteraceae bacterium]